MTRKEAIQILSTRDRYGVPCGYTSGYQEALDMAIEALTAEPKTGEWILTDFPDEQTYKCSSCNEHWVFLEGSPYDNGAYFCPNCGAKMGKNVELNKIGKWIAKDDEIFAQEYYCSKCGNRAEVDLYGEWILSDFCPNCGAKMEVTK